MSGYNFYYIPENDVRSNKVSLAGCTHYKGELIADMEYSHYNREYIVKTLKQDIEEDNVYNFINGDIVEAKGTGEVFLYVGSMYYNLSAGKKEMRGRKAIKREIGPVVKLTNIANSGALFKEVLQNG